MILDVVNSTSTKAVPLSQRLSILHSFETISSISGTAFVTAEDSKFVSEVIQLLGWLTTRDLKVWSFPKSMFNSYCTSLSTPPGPSTPCVRAVRESDSQNLVTKLRNSIS